MTLTTMITCLGTILVLVVLMEGLTSWVPDLHGSRGQIDGKARGKGEGSGSEHTPREEHDEHTQNSYDTRPIAPERAATGPIESSQGKIGQRAPSNPHRRGKNTLGRVLTTWRQDNELQGLVQRWMRDAKSIRGW